MFGEIKKESELVRILTIMLIAAVGIYLLGIAWQIIGLFSDIIVVLISAWILSFVLEPVVSRLNQLTHLSKAYATFVVYLFLLIIITITIFLFIPTVTAQIKMFSELIPRYLSSAPSFVSRWGDLLVSTLNNSASFIPSIAQFFFLIFISLIISFYLIIDKERINEEIFAITPHNWHEKIEFTQKVVRDIFSSFLRVQLLFGILSGLITWAVLRIFNLDFAAFIALLAGIFAAIPLVGPVLAIIPPTLVALIVDPGKAFFVFIILLVAQQFIFNVFGPRILGKAFKIHPIIVLISFLVGAKVAGGAGAILAIPILGILAVIIRELSRYYLRGKNSLKI